MSYSQTSPFGNNRGFHSEHIRVLFVIPGESDGASMIFVKRQLDAIQKNGVVGRSFFLSSRTSPRQIFNELRLLRKEIIEFKPDLIHAHYGSVTACLSVIASRLPVVVTYRGSDLNPEPGVFWFRTVIGRLLSQLAALRSRAIICVSNPLRERLWWNRGLVTVIPTGVDTMVFYPFDRKKAREQLGWRKEELVVLFNAGRNPRLKGLDMVEAAVDVAKKHCGDIRLFVLNGCVDPKKIPVFMNASDCLVLSSRHEGSPNVVKEALACNLPIVSVNVGDVSERLAGVQPSAIVERDPRKIGRAVAEILKIRERSNGFAAIGELSMDKCTKSIISVYESIIARP